MSEATQLRYLQEVLPLDPSEDGIELTLRRRAHLDLGHPPACPPPFGHLPRRLRASAKLDELRDSLRAGQAGSAELVADLRATCLPDQAGQLERLLAYEQERAEFVALRPRLGSELSDVLENVWLGQVAESVPAAESYLESLEHRPRDRAGLARRIGLVRHRLPALAALEPELLQALESRDPGRDRGQRTWLALAVLALVYLVLHLIRGAGTP